LAPAALELHDVSVAYGKLQAVRALSLRVEVGEAVALLGANGAGKSTTLRSISGLGRPRTGRILINGEDATGWPADRIAHAGVVHVPEGRQVFARMTVRENLMVGQFARPAAEPIDRELEHVQTLFPLLRDRAHQRAGSLSGGEQQMLAIGRALMGSPKVLMLDEPSLGLAPLVIERIFDAIDQINEGGTSVLLVEQNVRLALASSDRAYVLASGELRVAGRSEHLAEDASVQEAYLGGSVS
jgi:branched-chain amino acid transport system ATP-binding protein